MKRCLRCHQELPDCDIYGNFCWDCREAGLTDADRALSKKMSRNAWRWRNIERVRAYDREYQRRRSAA